MYSGIRSGNYVPTPDIRFASDVGYRMAKIQIGLYEEKSFMNNDI